MSRSAQMVIFALNIFLLMCGFYAWRRNDFAGWAITVVNAAAVGARLTEGFRK